MEVTVKNRIVEELKQIAGADHVSTAQADLYFYSQDMTENEPSWPDIVVMPDSVEEIQEVLRLANRERIAVTPYTAGGNVGGLTIPLKGGIMLDMRRMNRVVEFNEEDRYIVVEPGFNFGDLRRFLDKQAPHLWYGFPSCPPSSSVMSNALLDGFGYNRNQLGTNHEGATGLEVVLPTGELVKIGSCSVSPFWFSRAPLPDLAGLFFSWQGATGVVTKIGVQLWPRHALRLQQSLVTTGIYPTAKLVRRLGRTRTCEICGFTSYDIIQSKINDSSLDQTEARMSAEAGPQVIGLMDGRLRGTYDRPPGADKFGVNLRLEADTEDEMKAKVAFMKQVIKEELEGTDYIEHPVCPADLSDYPMRAGLGIYVGAQTWIGSLGPTSQWEKALEIILPTFDKYRLMRIVACTCFKNAHYGYVRPIIGYNKGDPDEFERVKKCVREFLIAVLDTGFVPYKAPYWAVEEMMRRGDPGWVNLLRRVKKMLDPNNIMNPQRYGDTGD